VLLLDKEVNFKAALR